MKNILLVAGGVLIGLILVAFFFIALLGLSTGAGGHESDTGNAANPPNAMVCAETDSGKDIIHAGSTTWHLETHNDSCSNIYFVNEYYCQDGEEKFELINCRSFGMDVCNAGQCESLPCNDSDGGDEPGVAGSVFYDGSRNSDICIDFGALREFYCTDSGSSSDVVDCKSKGEICWNEECSALVCEDSDEGNDPHVVGQTSMRSENGYDHSAEDHCRGGSESAAVTEFYCNNGYAESVDISCGYDEYCRDGECVPEQCFDTDGGINYNAEGEVKKGLEVYKDVCEGSTDILKEYYCNGNEVKYVEHICTSFAGCIFDRCA